MAALLKKISLLVLCLAMTACATQSGLREEFERSMKAYNRLLRWQEVETAGMSYMQYEQRDDFMRRAEQLKRRGITFTDYRILSSEYLPETKTGDVVAEFDYFILPSNKIKTLSYRQKWVYQDLGSAWKLTTGLPTFE